MKLPTMEQIFFYTMGGFLFAIMVMVMVALIRILWLEMP